MNIQIFSRKKSKDSKKAERFFSDRRIQFHSVNLDEKEMSKGEFEKVKNAIGGAEVRCRGRITFRSEFVKTSYC
jgi:arsenate reductase